MQVIRRCSLALADTQKRNISSYPSWYSRAMALIKLSPEQGGNRFSQSGEELVVRQLLEFGPKNPLLVEFGGSRGFDNSNMIAQAVDGVADVILIEGSASRYEELKKNTSSLAKVQAIRAFVGYQTGKDSLDQILRDNGTDPEDVFGVSIDIDGDDALVFENMGLRPDFVIVEYNPTLPLDGYFRNTPGKNMGSNVSELRRIGLELGYFEAALTPTNLVLVSNRLADRVEKINLLDEANKLDNPKFGIAYDGTIVRFSGQSITTQEIMDGGWSRATIVQPLPRWLRELAGGPFGHPRGRRARRFFSVAMAVITRPFSSLRLALSRRKDGPV